MIRGGGDARLYVQDTGPMDAPAIVFIHGFSQCALAWHHQMQSELARDFRLIAMDIRGHGRSDRPRDGYDAAALWARDLDAIITELRLEGAVLVGWSYGGVIASDYIRTCGDEQIAGVQLVGAISRLGEPLISGGFLGDEFLALVPGFFSTETNETVSTLARFLALTVQQPPSAEELYLALGYNVSVPPYVRQALLARHVNNDDVFAMLRKPVSLVHGEADRIVSPTMCAHLERLMPDAAVATYANVGHMPFQEAPERFNRELHAFASACARPLSLSAAARLVGNEGAGEISEA
jgi:pimeloyl-ACP methyl ester carboxylesterase